MFRLLWKGKKVLFVIVEFCRFRLVCWVLMDVMWVEFSWFIWLVLMFSVMLFV